MPPTLIASRADALRQALRLAPSFAHHEPYKTRAWRPFRQVLTALDLVALLVPAAGSSRAWCAGGSVVVVNPADHVDHSRLAGLIAGVAIGVVGGLAGAMWGSTVSVVGGLTVILVTTGGGRLVRAYQTLRHGAAQRRSRTELPAHTYLAMGYRQPGASSPLAMLVALEQAATIAPPYVLTAANRRLVDHYRDRYGFVLIDGQRSPRWPQSRLMMRTVRFDSASNPRRDHRERRASLDP